jgi:hypothetical protein
MEREGRRGVRGRGEIEGWERRGEERRGEERRGVRNGVVRQCIYEIRRPS